MTSFFRRLFGQNGTDQTVHELERAIAAIREAADAQRGAAPSNEFKIALNRLADLKDVAPSDKAAAIADMLSAVQSPTGAGFLSVWLGSWVEGGADARVTVEPLLEALLRWTKKLDVPRSDAESADPMQPDEEVVQGLQYFGNAVVAHIVHLPNGRELVRERTDVVSELRRIETHCLGATWILRLLEQCSGTLLVINVGKRIGARVRYENIANNFHLFSLLQHALKDVMPDVFDLDEDILAVARGDAEGAYSDSAVWHFGQPFVPEAELGGSVWGEGSPLDIATIDGTQVLLLWAPLLGSRSWDSAFFSPIIQSAMPNIELLEVVDETVLQTWWTRLSLPETPGMTPGSEA